MSIITISRGTYSKGRDIAEIVAKKLGYECVARRILLEASKDFNIPEIKLSRALHDSPSILNRFMYGKEKYVAYIRHALLQHLRKDNVVYHGLAGHFFLEDVPHVLKVRIVTNVQDRIQEEIKREKISEKEARYLIVKDDAERRKWSLNLYGIDTWDPLLYDLVLNVSKMSVENAADIIVKTSKLSCFQSTEASQAIFNDLLISSRVLSILVEKYPDVEVKTKKGVVSVHCKAPLTEKDTVYGQIERMLKDVPDVKEFDCQITPDAVPD